MPAEPYAVSTGHDAATGIAVEVLCAGGNAVDAGVAASIALTVLHSEQVQLGGVAPMIIRMAGEGITYTIDGVGRWPAKADRSLFHSAYRGRMPIGVLRTVVPGAPDAWIAALTRFGTMGFAELAYPAFCLARDGFPAHDQLVSSSARFEKIYRQNVGNAAIWLPGGRCIEPGQIFVQADLSNTLQRLINADTDASRTAGRLAGLRAVRDTFYTGEMATQMADHVADLNGWLALQDLAAQRTAVDVATVSEVFGGNLHTCGPWSQGPALSQALMIYEKAAHTLSPKSGAETLHLIAESINLAMADREAFYGDPEFIDVPLGELLAPEYAAGRATLIRPDKAFGILPKPGPVVCGPVKGHFNTSSGTNSVASLDTSVAAVIDAQGNVFACTPSDSSTDAPVVPGLGFVISTRGGQSHTAEGHPSALAPGKRPRITACPMLFISGEGRVIAGGGPGADLQLQAMVQTLVHHLSDQQSLADAVAAPRVFSFSPPTSGAPHLAFPGRLVVEENLPDASMISLADLGHKTVCGSGTGINNPLICFVAAGPGHASYEAVGDPRGEAGQRAAQAKGVT